LEVKSTVDVKPEHEWDLAIQFHVLEGAGIPVRWTRLMHLNRDYVYRGGNYDLKRLFTFTNLTRRVRARRRDVVAALKAMRKALGGERPPSIAIGPHCNAPYVCPFYDHCHDDQPEHSIDELPRLGVRLRERFTTMGVAEIGKIPTDFEGLSSLLQEVDPALRGGMRYLPPPTDATPDVLTLHEAWSAQAWLKQGLDMLSRSEKWNFVPRITYELDAYKGLFRTGMRATSRLQLFKALAYDAFRDARFKLRLCPECKRPFVPVGRQHYCSSRCSQAVRTRKWRKAHPEKNREIRRQQYRRSARAKIDCSRLAAASFDKLF
jgi:hypothetical protein